MVVDMTEAIAVLIESIAGGDEILATVTPSTDGLWRVKMYVGDYGSLCLYLASESAARALAVRIQTRPNLALVSD